MSRRARTLLLVVGVCCALGARSSPSAREGRARELADQGVDLLGQSKAEEAESLFVEAAEIDPRNPRYFYLLARSRARLGVYEPAIKDLERAAGLGFTDFGLIEKNPDLESLRQLPRFRRLIENKDRYLRRTAEGNLVALRRRFGETYHYELDDKNRLIFATAAGGPSHDDLKTALAEESAALGAELFKNKPEAYVTILMPTAKDYGQLIRFRNVPGMYADETKTLVIKEVSYVLAHEFAHALHAADRAADGQGPHAEWLTEGLGVMCEAATFTGGRFSPRDNPRFASMPQGAKRKALIPLERLLPLKHDEFLLRPNLTYGQSGYFVLFLWDRKRLKPFYDAYKKSYDKDSTGRVALEQVMEKKLPEIQEEFRVWLAARAKG